MKAQDIMTRDVATVGPDTSVRDIAALMMEKHISGVPVIGHDETIVGIVSESDLLHWRSGNRTQRKWWFGYSPIPMRLREYAKAHGLAARDVTVRYVISVRDDAQLRIAGILDKQRIRRVPCRVTAASWGSSRAAISCGAKPSAGFQHLRRRQRCSAQDAAIASRASPGSTMPTSTSL
jgi:CBS domain-containing protein